MFLVGVEVNDLEQVFSDCREGLAMDLMQFKVYVIGCHLLQQPEDASCLRSANRDYFLLAAF